MLDILSVLLLEDQVNRQRAHEAILEQFNANLIVQTTLADARSMIAGSPCFDLVVSDLNLDITDAQNADGEEFGRWLRSKSYPSLTALCTTHFNEDTVEYNRAKGFFDQQISTSAVPEYGQLLELAKEKKIERFNEATLHQVKEAGLKEKLLQVHGNGPVCEEQKDIARDFDLVVLQPFSGGIPNGNPFFAWRKLDSGGVYLELYGVPNVMAYGQNFETSMVCLNDVMSTTYIDLEHEKVGGDLVTAKEVLTRVYSNIHQK